MKSKGTQTPIDQQQTLDDKEAFYIVPLRPELFSAKQDQRLRGKHSRLQRELSLAISKLTEKCSIVHHEDWDYDLPPLELSSDLEDCEEESDGEEI